MLAEATDINKTEESDLLAQSAHGGPQTPAFLTTQPEATEVTDRLPCSISPTQRRLHSSPRMFQKNLQQRTACFRSTEIDE